MGDRTDDDGKMIALLTAISYRLERVIELLERRERYECQEAARADWFLEVQAERHER